VFPLEKAGEGWHLKGTETVLTGSSAGAMLAECGDAALLACTLGAQFDAMLLREQARDMSRRHSGRLRQRVCGSGLR
jgi:hypothetical protein